MAPAVPSAPVRGLRLAVLVAASPRGWVRQVEAKVVHLEVVPWSESIAVCVPEWAHPSAEAGAKVQELVVGNGLEWVYPNGCRPLLLLLGPLSGMVREEQPVHPPSHPFSCALGSANPSVILRMQLLVPLDLLPEHWTICPLSSLLECLFRPHLPKLLERWELAVPDRRRIQKERTLPVAAVPPGPELPRDCWLVVPVPVSVAPGAHDSG